jgi:hypothetical protein
MLVALAALAAYGRTFKGRAVARLLPPEGAAAQLVAREVGIEVGTSIGLAAVTPDLPSGATVLHAVDTVLPAAATVLHVADTAFCAAKRGGRKQVVTPSPVTRQDAAAQTLAATRT